MKDSKIEWCHHTFNPWWGCQRISPGCEHCYAETFDRRVHGKDKTHWGPTAARRFFGEAHWAQPLKWEAAAVKAGERHRVFCASMADVFEDREGLIAERKKLFRLIRGTPNLDWLLLTKRPENIARLWPFSTAPGPKSWPNIWLGTTVEDQLRAVERIPHLAAVDAAVRFLSCEPLLEQIDLSKWLDEDETGFVSVVRWVIIGGESGAGARPFNVAWARKLVNQCRDGGRAEAAPFVKQLGAHVIDRNDAGWSGEDPASWDESKIVRVEHDLSGYADDYQGAPVRVHLGDKKGGDWRQWPADLRVREYPAGTP